MKNRLIWMFSLLLLLAVLRPLNVEAAGETRYCQGCKRDVALTEWTALGGEQTEMVTLTSGKHYYLTANVSGAPESAVLLSGAGCIDLNGFNITAGEGCAAISCGSGTTNIMGSGTITGSRAAADTGATIHTHSSAVVHIYGGTITKSGNYPAIYIGKNVKVHLYDGAHINTAGTFSTYPTAVTMQQTGSLFHMHGGTITGGNTTSSGGAIRVDAGNMIMDGGTIYGGKAVRGGAITVGEATLTINNGTITGGTATETFGGGNLYVNYGTITINGGLITKGVAESTCYGGGNLASRLGTYIINGGTISEGSSSGTNGGGNVYLSGATLTMNGGTITGGTFSGTAGNSGGGNVCLVSSSKCTMNGGTISGGSSKGKGGGNVFLSDSTFTMHTGTITGGNSTNTGSTSGGGNIFLFNFSTFTQNDGSVTYGTSASSYGGGNIYLDDSTYNMYGGDISYGTCTSTSCRGGGNVYVQSDDCFLNIVAGILQYGYLEKGQGNNIHQRYGKLYMGPGASMGNKGSGTKGTQSVYIYHGNLESYGTLVAGLKVDNGKVYLKGGKYYNLTYGGSSVCQITGGEFRTDLSQYVPEGYQWVTVTTTGSYKYVVLPVGGKTDAVLVNYEGKEALTNTPGGSFNATTYSHIKLYNDVTISVSKELWVDLNGNDLTVTAEGKVNAFDTANDTYDTTACGTIINEGTAEISLDVYAPNGNRYLAIADETGMTMHRLEMRLSAVSLRTSQAGIYYKAVYYCDAVLSEKVQAFGVVLSLNNMPGEDFMDGDSDDINQYTVAGIPFQSGVVATSGAVFGIMKEDRDPSLNGSYGEMRIYANPYILFDLNDGKVCVGDNQNVGETTDAADFTGHAYSLHNVMDALDENYSSYDESARELIENFYSQWKNKGMSWSFVNIGKQTPAPEETVPEETVPEETVPEETEPEETEPEETEPEPTEPEKDVLELVNGKAYCDACQKTVTWKALTQEAYATTAYGTAKNGAHVYLAEDITYTGSSVFLSAPNTTGQTVCIHLNDKSLTVTKTRALVGQAGVLNVMGDGVVAGYSSSSGYGGAVQINTTSVEGVVNLYGGTYRQAENSVSGGCPISIRSNGGLINVYEKVRVEANVTGRAACIGSSYYANSKLAIYGAHVDGDIYLTGASASYGKTSTLILDDATVSGTVDANGENMVILQGKSMIGLLDMEEKSLIKLKDFDVTNSISVKATGIFTAADPNAADYLRCFTPTQSDYVIVNVNGVLQSRKGYLAKVEPDASGTAYCPVCAKSVQWQALETTDAQILATNGQHLYLTKSLEYNANVPFIVAKKSVAVCLHLNGYDITATASQAVYSSGGTVNVMGSGNVSGHTYDSEQGAAVVINGTNATVNLYGGKYHKYTGSNAASPIAAVDVTGGTLNVYADARFADTNGKAIFVGGNSGTSNLKLQDVLVEGDVELITPSENTVTATVDSAVVLGEFTVSDGSSVTLNGRPVISKVDIAQGTLLTLSKLLIGTDVAVSAEEIFTPAVSYEYWKKYFSAADEGDWVTIQDGALSCRPWETLPNGRKILVVGNSMTYYGRYVFDMNHAFGLECRQEDQGYLYQVCKANYLDVSVTNFTFGNHSLSDFYSGKCAADRGHNGHNHLEDLTDRNYDYVIMQQGDLTSATGSIYEDCKPMMDIFLEVNPNTKFVFLIPRTVHVGNTEWISSVKELEEHGVIVVDWGKMINDIITGETAVPDAQETYGKFSFIVNKSSSDGRHPNVLAGYLMAQMTYCAITGETAVGQDYSFWNNKKANIAFDATTYKKSFYSYDSTVPSNTNFEAVFKSPTEMTGLQKLIDLYLEMKPYLDY